MGGSYGLCKFAYTMCYNWLLWCMASGYAIIVNHCAVSSVANVLYLVAKVLSVFKPVSRASVGILVRPKLKRPLFLISVRVDFFQWRLKKSKRV